MPKRKIVILAEAKRNPTYNLLDYVYGDKEGKSNELPAPLLNIFNNYVNNLTEYEELDKVRRDAMKLVIAEYQRNNGGKSPLSLPNEEFVKNIANPVESLVGVNNEKRLSTLRAELKKDENNFVDVNVNPLKKDDTFIKEANNVKDYYRNNPNVTVDVIEFYKGYSDINKVKESLDKADTYLQFGHDGQTFGGYNHKEVADMLKANNTINECYMGTCNFKDNISDYNTVQGKTFYYRPESSWLGFNPASSKEGDLLEGMYSRYNGENTTEISKTPVQYETQKFKKGGVVLSTLELESLKRLKI